MATTASDCRVKIGIREGPHPCASGGSGAARRHRPLQCPAAIGVTAAARDRRSSGARGVAARGATSHRAWRDDARGDRASVRLERYRRRGCWRRRRSRRMSTIRWRSQSFRPYSASSHSPRRTCPRAGPRQLIRSWPCEI